MLIKGCAVSLFFGVISAAGVAVAQSQDQESEAAIQDDFPQLVTLPSSGGIEWVAPGAESKSLSDLLADFATGSAQVTREDGAVIKIRTASHTIGIDALSGRVRITEGGAQPSSEDVRDTVAILPPVVGLDDAAWLNRRNWDFLRTNECEEEHCDPDECDEGDCDPPIVLGNDLSPCADDDYVCQREWYLCTLTNLCNLEERLTLGDQRPWMMDQVFQINPEAVLVPPQQPEEMLLDLQEIR